MSPADDSAGAQESEDDFLGLITRGNHNLHGLWFTRFRARVAARSMSNLLWIAYLVIGIVVAADRTYFEHLGNVDNVASAIFAVLAWPLLLLGVDITLR